MKSIFEDKTVLVSGCSFSAEEFSYPSLFPCQVSNLSHHGAGNTYIRRQIQKELLSENEYDYVVVQWSTIDRWDYPWPVLTKDDTPLVNMDVGDDIEGKLAYLRMGTSYNDKSKHFYDNYYSIYGQLVETLENILFTQQTIEKKGIPYRMLTIANWLTTDVSFDMIKNIDEVEGDLIRQRISTLKIEELLETFKSADLLQELINSIDWSKFMWTTDFKIGEFGDGFTEFLIDKGQRFEFAANTHPSESQNKLLFDEIIYPQFLKDIKVGELLI